MAEFFQGRIVEGECCDFCQGGDGAESVCEGFDFIDGTIYECEFRRFDEGALGGDGLSGSAAGTKYEGVDFTAIEVEVLVDSTEKARAISVVAVDGFFSETDGIDGADGFRVRGDG